MTWNRDDPQGNEGFKVRWEIIQYTRGRGLDLGCGPQKTFPHFIGVDNNIDEQLFGIKANPDIKVESCEKLDLFATNSFDFVFSSHLLEHFDYAKVPAILCEWMRVIKHNGYLVLYLPDEDAYPKVGEEGANHDHKWNVSYQKVVDAMQDTYWDLVDFQTRHQDKEYSLYFVFKKQAKGNNYSYKLPKPNKTAAVVRYGAFGDLLQASSVFAGLKKQGYHVTLFTSPPGCDVVKHDPHIDAFYYQDKDQVPNHLLGEFWHYHRQKYDKFVNLSESVEGTFLALPGRSQHEWTPVVRHKMLNYNYLQFQHELADVPHHPQVKFFATDEEKQWAKQEKAKIGGFVVLWALAGSSVHKTYGMLDRHVASLLMDFPDVKVVTTGNEAGAILEQGWENEPRVMRRAGKWSIRETLAFAQIADLVIGPETGVLNAVAQEDMPKIVFLSHSTEENLTRDWVNTHSMISKNTSCPGRGNNEAPVCHQLHYGWVHCKKTENGLAQCMEDIDHEQVYKALWHCITWAKEKVA